MTTAPKKSERTDIFETHLDDWLAKHVIVISVPVPKPKPKG